MTRYDPHPQDYDDARTGPQASREAAGRDETASRVHLEGRVEYLTGERDRARHLAAALEADNARLTEERDEARAGWQRMSDYADHRGARVAELEAENWEFIEARKQRDAAEAHARRAEDALQRVRAMADEWADRKRSGNALTGLVLSCAATDLREALDGTEHDCSTCTDCLHNGQRCCGCYDGACCQTSDATTKETEDAN